MYGRTTKLSGLYRGQGGLPQAQSIWSGRLGVGVRHKLRGVMSWRRRWDVKVGMRSVNALVSSVPKHYSNMRIVTRADMCADMHVNTMCVHLTRTDTHLTRTDTHLCRSVIWSGITSTCPHETGSSERNSSSTDKGNETSQPPQYFDIENSLARRLT